MNIYETVTFLILVGVNIATLLLFIQHRRLEHMQNPLRRGNNSNQLDRIEAKLDKVLQRIGQLKTREADDERDDQKLKSHVRYEQKKAHEQA